MAVRMRGPEVKVAFVSKAWGGDYEKFLSGAFERKRDAVPYPFDWHLLVANNGVPEEAPLRDLPFATCWVGLEQQLHKADNYYATGELCAVWQCHGHGSEYLCFVQGDCVTEGGDWVTPAIKVLEKEPDVMVVSPLSEVNTWHDAQGYDHYMSDQAFVVRVKDFMNPEVYAVVGTDPDYPDYGGDSFEAMVGKYLKKSGRKRKILTGFWTIHPQY